MFFCINCFQCFHSKEILTNHHKVCSKVSAKQAIKMHGYHKQSKVPFVIYADFESILERVQNISKE